MANAILENLEKKYQLSEKDRLAIIGAGGPSVFEVIEKKREEFKAMNGDYFGQQPIKMMGVRS